MLSKKEIISIYQIILAVLCLIAFFLYTWNISYPFDVRIYAAQCAVIATAIICLIFALGTWFYSSNFKETRLHVRIFSVIVLLIFNVALLITAILGALNYFGAEIDGFEAEIWDGSALIMLMVAIVLTIAVAVLMIPMNVFLIMRIVKKSKKSATK